MVILDLEVLDTIVNNIHEEEIMSFQNNGRLQAHLPKIKLI